MNDNSWSNEKPKIHIETDIALLDCLCCIVFLIIDQINKNEPNRINLFCDIKLTCFIEKKNWIKLKNQNKLIKILLNSYKSEHIFNTHFLLGQLH